MNLTCLSLNTEEPVRGTATHLRGFIASRHRQEVVFHSHQGETVSVYGYPLVQYKIINGQAVVIGIGAAAERIKKLPGQFSVLALGSNEYKITDTHLRAVDASFGYAHSAMSYSFLTPWLALNEENYVRYQTSGPAVRSRLLERILIGNILSMSKGLGYVVTEEIRVSSLDVYPMRTPVRLKGVPMTGFKGTFAVNFDLPDLIGLGKSVSRGFGTITRRRS